MQLVTTPAALCQVCADANPESLDSASGIELQHTLLAAIAQVL